MPKITALNNKLIQIEGPKDCTVFDVTRLIALDRYESVNGTKIYLKDHDGYLYVHDVPPDQIAAVVVEMSKVETQGE